MKRMLVVAAGSVAGALGAAGLIMAAPAMAAPDSSVDCQSGCVNRAEIAADATGAPWTDFFAAVAPWEKVFDPAGDGNGVWEQGVTAVNGGAWEKVFPPAE